MNDRFNTIAGWTLGAGIVALGLSSVSSRIFHADRPESPEEPGYFIEGAAEEGGADSGPPLALLLAQASPDAGEAVFAKCTTCHTIAQGGPNGIGPNLFGVVGETIAQGRAGFAFSSALSEKGGTWTYEALDEWLKSPRAYASGTKMSFAGLSSPEDRANVIMYMHANGGGPPLPEPPAAEEELGEGADEGAGSVEGGDVDAATAVGGAGGEVPVASQNAGGEN